MKRRGFLGTIAAVAAGVSLAFKSPAKEKHPFNSEIIEKILRDIDPALNRNPLISDGLLTICDGYVQIYGITTSARIGDFILTNTGDSFYVIETGKSITYEPPSQSISLKCRPLEYKTIVGQSVIKINGKWKRFKSGLHAPIAVEYIPNGSTFREGGV